MGLSKEQREQLAAQGVGESETQGFVPADGGNAAPGGGVLVNLSDRSPVELVGSLDEVLERLAAIEAAASQTVEAAKPLSTPDVTPVQAKAFGAAVVGLLAAVGLPVGGQVEGAILAVSIGIPSVLILADAFIRFGRAKYVAATRR